MPTMTTKPTTKPTETENIYCTNKECRKTQKHTKDGETYVCSGCGNKKRAIAKRLDEALGLMESVDEPVLFKHEGLRKKTQAGAHRFDKGVEYDQMEFDGKWGTKSKQDKLGS